MPSGIGLASRPPDRLPLIARASRRVCAPLGEYA